VRSLRNELAIAGLAVQFLTRLPVRDPGYSAERLAASPRWYPAIGALVGVGAGLIFWATSLLWPPSIAALAAVAGATWLTGALHEDGFADLCDGLGGGSDRTHALEIMRDSRIGAYGAAGLIITVLATVLALGEMTAAQGAAALLAAHSVSRAAMLAVMVALPYARSDGAAAGVSRPLSSGSLATAAACVALAVLPLLLLAPLAAVAALAAAALVAFAVIRLLRRRLGGYTGDGLGATQHITALAVLLAALPWL